LHVIGLNDCYDVYYRFNVLLEKYVFTICMVGYLIYTFKEFTIMKHTKISNSELSSISTNHQYISDKNGNLSIRIELKYPEHLNLYLVVLENHVK